MSKDLAQQWAAWDPNPLTKKHMIEADDEKLSQMFSKRIGFGTAGLRARMQPGPTGMNDVVVFQTAQGIIEYYSQESADIKKKILVIGYDHRASPEWNLSSKTFALVTALVARHRPDWKCVLLEDYVATPMVPFSMQKLKKDDDKNTLVVGIMVTASHNPAQDAGYKVYGPDACQIRSPVDAGIAAAILENLEPWGDYGKELEDLRNGDNKEKVCLGLGTDAKPYIDTYFEALAQSGLITNQASKMTIPVEKQPRFCYTALHGVGYPFAVRSFETFGLSSFISVPSQQSTNPLFPTVPFPNPEERGALDLAQAHAKQHNCCIVLANDPDADRLAVAEFCQDTRTWTVLTGDQMGALFAWWLSSTMKGKCHRPMAMCTSTVSSQLVAEMCRKKGLHVEDTLTGFKWIGARASELHRSGEYNFVFAYEEAIGFCCGAVVFDKDGISALSVFAELTLAVYEKGLTLKGQLQALYHEYGEFVSNNGYYIMSDSSVTIPIFAHMCRVLKIPTSTEEMAKTNWTDGSTAVVSYPVASVRYLGEPGFDSKTPDQRPTLPTSSSSPMLTVRFCNGCVAQFRASGTEPKFKYYIELKGTPGVERSKVKEELMTMSNVILDALVQPSQHGLVGGENAKK